MIADSSPPIEEPTISPDTPNEQGVEVPGVGLGPTWSIGPVPDWVDKVASGLPCAGATMVVLLDQQKNWLGPRLQHFTRIIYRIRDDADVKEFKLLRIPLGHDRVEVIVHALSVYRGQQDWRHLDPWFTTTTPWQPVSKEVEAGPRHVVKDQPAMLLHRLMDVAVGDYVEIAHTVVYPVEPELAGVICGSLKLAREVPVQRQRLRLLFPHRHVAMRAVAVQGQPNLRRHEDFTEFVWYSQNVPALPEALIHERRRASIPHIQYSEIDSWDALVRLVRPFFECDEPPAEIAEIATALARDLATKRAQVRAVMRYVQDEFAYEVYDTREWLIRPKPLARVLAEKATDCKGKTFLMVSLLRALGIGAEVVLVNQHGMDLRAGLPSLTDLDHMIVMVAVDGHEYFIDPTLRCQRGDLETLTALPFLYGVPLVLGRGPVEIPHMCGRPAPQSEVFAHYKVGAPGKPTRLNYKRIDQGADADAVRTIQRGDEPVDLGRQLHAGLNRIYPELRAVERVVTRDDETANSYHFTAEIQFGNIWRRDPDGEYYLDVVPVQLIDELWSFVERPNYLHHRKLCVFASSTSTLQISSVPHVEGAGFEHKLPGLQIRHSVDVRGSCVTVVDTVKLCCHAITDVDAVLAEIQRAPQRLRVRLRPFAPTSVVHTTRAPDKPARTGAARPFRPRFR